MSPKLTVIQQVRSKYGMNSSANGAELPHYMKQ